MDLFFQKVEKTDSCWVWTGCHSSLGYGKLTRNNKSYKAHRYSWMIHNGSIPSGMFVLHHCDVPNCVNPDHLFLGTQTDNMKDMDNKGRRTIGEKKSNAKLNNKKVKEIRQLLLKKVTQEVIAKQYGVSQKIIWNIKHRIYWSHV